LYRQGAAEVKVLAKEDIPGRTRAVSRYCTSHERLRIKRYITGNIGHYPFPISYNPLIHSIRRSNVIPVDISIMDEDSPVPVAARRRGRPRIPRAIDKNVSSRCFSPECCPNEDGVVITLLPDELELLRLVDLEGMEQEEAAGVLGVSRRTAWRDLHTARRKVADALTSGKTLQIGGCPRAIKGLCPRKCPRFSKYPPQDSQ